MKRIPELGLRNVIMSDDLKFSPPGLTYDDVLLLPAHSDVLPAEADTTARLSPADHAAASRWSPRPWTP